MFTLHWTIILAAAIAIVLLELALWKLFLRRVDGLHLHLASTTRRGLFTVMRIRVCALLHGIFLLTTTILSLFFLW